MNILKLTIILSVLFLSCSKENTAQVPSTKAISYFKLDYSKITAKKIDSGGYDTVKLKIEDENFDFIQSVYSIMPNTVNNYILGVMLNSKDNKIDYAYYMSGSKSIVKIMNKNETISADAPKWYSGRDSNTMLSNPGIMCSYTDYGPFAGTKLYECIDKEETFIPFRFYKLINGKAGWRYGWIRCKITTTSIDIYEFAYNNTINESLYAGEK